MKKIITFLTVVFCISANAQIITTVAGNGSGAYSGDGGQATAAALNKPEGLTFDPAGNLIIVDYANNRIRKVNSAGIITTIAGTGAQGFAGDGGQATAAKFYTPESAIYDAAGNLYIDDEDNFRVRKINTAGIINTIAGNGTGGYGGDGGQATAAELLRAVGLTFDATGNLYIVDNQNHRIRKLSTSGIITTFAGIGTGGYSGDGGQATAAELNLPRRVSFFDGNMYIADYGNNRIRMVNTAGIITTVVGNGTAAFSGDGGQASSAELNIPSAVIFDGAGNMYIGDYGNYRLRKVTPFGIISTIAGNGTNGFSGDGGLATAAQLNDMSDLVFDASGNLYFADYGNNRVRMITNVGQTTGIKNVGTNMNEQISIYPNPNNGSFVIELNNTAKKTMQIYDVNGKLVLSQSINGKTTIDASNLNEGIYNISLQSSEGVVNKKLVIVK